MDVFASLINYTLQLNKHVNLVTNPEISNIYGAVSNETTEIIIINLYKNLHALSLTNSLSFACVCSLLLAICGRSVYATILYVLRSYHSLCCVGKYI